MKANDCFCPRCGYDLSGIAESWQDACPLEGTCSECGLIVRWAEVLNPILTIPRWSFEHAIPERAAGRALPTWIRALLPARFWRALRLEHPIIASRLAVWLAMAAFATHAAVYASTVWLRYANPWSSWWRSRDSFVKVAAGSLWPYTSGDTWDFLLGGEFPLNEEYVVGYLHWLLLGWFLITPLTFLVLTDTFRQVRVRYAHVWRAGIYSLSPLPLVVVLYAVALWVVAACGVSSWQSIGLDPAGLTVALPTMVLGAGAAWLVRFWWVVPRDYLRLPHAPGVSIAMLTVGGLGAVVLTVLLALLDRGN